MTFNTGNPIGSTDARDRSDNSENMDILENSTTLNAHPDRLGTMRKTRKGMELEHDNQISAHEAEHDAQIAAHEAEHDAQIAAHEAEHDAQIAAHEAEFTDRIFKMAFTPVGTFTDGATLTDARQTLLWEVSEGGDGHYYSWAGSFGTSGKAVTAGSSPSPIAAGSWVDRTDDSLRDEIRETVFQNMKRLCAEAGFNLVDGSFQLGGSLSGWPDVLWDWSTGRAYQWHLDEAITVAAGSTPATSGGIGAGAWVDRTDVSLRAEITPSVTEALRRSYADAGYNLVDGSFESGGTLTNTNDVLLHKASGIAYSWAGAFPKVVPAGSTPASTGGVGAGAWVDRSGDLLRQELFSGAITYHDGKASLRDFVSIKDFGAVGDGVADDTAAINLAITYASKIYIPDGVFKHSGISLIGVSNKYFYGTGTIKSTTNQAALISLSAEAHDIVFDGITFEGKISGTIDRGFNIDNSYAISIKNCTIKNFNEVGIMYGVTHRFAATHPITIENNDITHCGSGIYISSGEYANIRNNRIRLCGTIWSANSPSIDNFGGHAALIGGYSGWGIAGALGNCRVENNHIQENFYGLLLDGTLGTNPDHSHISGNQINHNQAYGMMVINIASCEQVIGNEILSTVGPGVWPPTGTSMSLIMASCNHLSLIGNTVDGGAANKVRLDNVVNSKFIGNNFYIGSNVEEFTQCQNNTWIGNDFMGNAVGVIRHAATINRTFLANSLGNTTTETVPVGVTFLSSWGNYDSALYAPLMYWRDAEGYLNVQGVIKSTNSGDSGGTICTLPAGFRVSKAIDVPVVGSSGIASLRLYTSGNLQMVGGGTTQVSINCRVKL